MDIQTKKAIHHLAWMLYHDNVELKIFDLGALKHKVEAAEYLENMGLGESDGLWTFTPNEKLWDIVNDYSLEEE